MRYITTPEPVIINNKPFTFSDYLAETVWVEPYWREDKSGSARIEMLITLSKKFTKAGVGSAVELTDAEYEAFRPLAMMQGKQMNPAHSIVLSDFLLAVASASSEAPSAFLTEKVGVA